VYYDHWIRLREVLLKDSTSCPVLQLWRSETLCALAKNPKLMGSLPPRPTIVSCNVLERKVYNRLEPCPCNSGSTYPWLTKLSEQRATIPKFSSITLVEWYIFCLSYLLVGLNVYPGILATCFIMNVLLHLTFQCLWNDIVACNLIPLSWSLHRSAISESNGFVLPNPNSSSFIVHSRIFLIIRVPTLLR